MIKVICRTNLDNYERENWPYILSSSPNLGDSIKAKSGKILKIVGITHCFCFEKDICLNLLNNVFVKVGEPYLKIELNK